MADPAGEFRDAIEKLIDRMTAARGARMGEGLPLSPGSLADALDDVSFATGYDGTDTTMPFTWDVSLWSGPDLWTGD